MKYRNKEYKTIIWDWRSTIYDPSSETLYPWVKPLLREYNDVNHILVSWALNVPVRREKIKSFGVMTYFKRIFVTNDKRMTFEEIFDELGYDADSTLIVGDNVNDEIAIAKDIGVDSEVVEVFVKNVAKDLV
ncbi:HAD hydrolase-like protein [bacterium]|nr:HAD hydrolase-like protein [bacterium]